MKAKALHTTLAASKTPMTVQSAAAPDVSLDTAELDRIVGVKGKPVGGVYQFGIPRRDPITQNKMSLDPAAPLVWPLALTSNQPAMAKLQ